MFRDKVVLVTGGTGSIGSEIVRNLLVYNPKAIRIYSRDETKQFELQQELKEYTNIRYLIGDIRDKQRLSYAMEDVDYIFHAAALKHVPACEYNPMEAVKTNVIGVQNLIEAALDNNVKKVISISTDKVVNPTNTMGATKLLSERLISAANMYKGNKPTIFACVRFGNVMGSRGSVIPLFREQIQQGLPVTVTHREMTRFMMSIPQAATLVLDAAKYSKGGEVFVLKMPILKITDLAECMIEAYEQATGLQYSGQIEEVGVRPGEKLYEELMTLDESERAVENTTMYIIPTVFDTDRPYYEGFNPAAHREYSSHTAPRLHKEPLRELLQTNHLTFSASSRSR
ncbi:polysaccharide biosynthesis protein [Paenibacillus barcinonensis]|jgi:FlaA1/EpsC-like NDP-sugar epimerase|uniref:UDP-N-acetylglucosamine 4,6-dehydratase family protein n=1 Tax=Paenibacillus TaxID=44249 RepID=UPI001C11D0A7|nr:MULTISPECIES: UDP-N-acetylglucosamine 4,6-dehydratase family protein [Paenibacillus]MBU5355390.1 polysaccharide biosynthesis protein [Paenibacillus barcinonensis]MDM5281334.1 polysaccharide biosynthesis protein [Paenibacillus silvae]